MILSYHPIYSGDENLLCAGRSPTWEDLNAIRHATAVILPQGCPETLYAMARGNCRHVFPNLDAKFRYPGKTGQIRLFRQNSLPHPATAVFASVDNLPHSQEELLGSLPFAFPFVFKFDWGGEGDTVFLVEKPETLEQLLDKARSFERSHRRGFLLQAFIPSGNRTLRIVVIGQMFTAYWRVQQKTDDFRSTLSRGAAIDTDSDPDLQQAGIAAARALSEGTGINLAGIDVLFSPETGTPAPLFLEINYFFGREGLGGTEKYYEVLTAEIDKWIDRLP